MLYEVITLFRSQRLVEVGVEGDPIAAQTVGQQHLGVQARRAQPLPLEALPGPLQDVLNLV